MPLRYLTYNDLDFKAWDNCIAGSFNGNLYGCSWYLDLLSERWDALVEDDYRSVMPLIIDNRWGQDRIILPVFAQELGIYSYEPISSSKTCEFIRAIPKHIKHYHIRLNKYNPVEINDFTIRFHSRFELDLIKPYFKMAADFNPALRVKLNLAFARGFTLVKGLSTLDLTRFITKNRIKLPRKISVHNYKMLRMVIAGLVRYKSGSLYGLYDSKNELTAAALFGWYNNHIYQLFLVSSPDQDMNYPRLFLIDRFLENYAETNSTLSFEWPLEQKNPGQYTDFAARESLLPEIRQTVRHWLLKGILRR
jgi:hypothetical protein